MKSTFLINNKYKKWGIIILLPSLVLGAMFMFWDISLDILTVKSRQVGIFEHSINLTDEIAFTGTVIGLLLIAFSREKIEDEYINILRLESIQWAVLINYALLILATWIFHGTSYLHVLIYNMLTILVIFILRFHYVLSKNKAQ